MKQVKKQRIQPRRLFIIAVALLTPGVAIICQPAQLTAQEPQAKTASALVAVVSRSGDMDEEAHVDAVVMIENGKLRQPYPENSEAAQRKFGSEYFATGKKYRMTWGGGEAGSVTIKSFGMGCNNIHAIVRAEDGGRVLPNVSALATDSMSLGRGPIARREATPIEHQALLRLAAQIYQARGTPLPLVRAMVNYYLTATDLDGDGKFELIGSFLATKGKSRRDLFLIAVPAGTTRLPVGGRPKWPLFKPALAHFQSYTMQPEGFDSAIDFVDQLDLDGDGVAEVFVRQHGFDAYGYAIYKRVRGTWKQIYTTAGDAC